MGVREDKGEKDGGSENGEGGLFEGTEGLTRLGE